MEFGVPYPHFQGMGVWFGLILMGHRTYPRINVGPCQSVVASCVYRNYVDGGFLKNAVKRGSQMSSSSRFINTPHTNTQHLTHISI